MCFFSVFFYKNNNNVSNREKMGKDCNCHVVLLLVGLTLWRAEDSSYLQKLTHWKKMEENCKCSSDISVISVKKRNCLCLTQTRKKVAQEAAEKNRKLLTYTHVHPSPPKDQRMSDVWKREKKSCFLQKEQLKYKTSQVLDSLSSLGFVYKSFSLVIETSPRTGLQTGSPCRRAPWNNWLSS